MNRALQLVVLLSIVQMAAAAAENSAPKLEDAAWLAGVWKSTNVERMVYEEHWTTPAGGGMVGMFRMLAGERVVVYEFQLIEQSSEGVFLRLRHYQPGMVDRDKEPIKNKLVEATKSKLVFENPANESAQRIAYELDDKQLLTVTVDTIRDGKPTKFVLKFQREAK